MEPTVLPSVAHDQPAALLLIETSSDEVVSVNDVARRLAPEVRLPAALDAWVRAAGLQVVPDGDPVPDTAPLSQLLTDAAAERRGGTVLRPRPGTPAEVLWATRTSLGGGPDTLRDRSLLVLMPLRPGPVPDRGSVLANTCAIAISDPTLDDDPLVWVSGSFEQVTGYTADAVLGRNCRFLQGPGTDPAAVQHLRAGIAAEETVDVTLLNHRRDGSAYFNHLVVSPFFDASGALVHHISVQTDVTQQVLLAGERDTARAQTESARAAQAAAEAAERFSRLSLTMSETLTTITTVEEVTAAISDVLAPELGAVGGGVALPNRAGTHLEFTSMASMPADTDATWSRIAFTEDVAVARSARTQQPLFYPDVEEMLAAHPGVTAHAPVPAMGANVTLPLLSGGRLVGVLFLYWARSRHLPDQQRQALQALARYTAQAVERAVLLAERRTAAEVLQQSLLTRLPEPDHLELRARYVPAAAEDYVGGDWYDAVVLPDGATTVVIGDVTGHDIIAAARMGQLRGLLRAYAFDRDEAPSEVVSRLDRALAGLRIDGLATLVMGRIEQTEDDLRAGLRRLRWTNAGHPPPILLLADGSTEVLDTPPELLIGLAPEAPRSDHQHVLPPESTLLLYSDGLIEHRGRSLGEGIGDLRRVLSAHAGSTLEELLDHLVTELIGTSPDDDCAVLAVRAHPEDRPRPPEAGPGRLG